MVKKFKGFTFIEIMVVIVIILIVAAIVLVSVNQSRKNARINGTKTSLKTTLPIIMSCKDSNGAVSAPSGSETGTNAICNNIPNANWPKLTDRYEYVSGGSYDSNNCNYQVSTNGDTAVPITCDCALQTCK